MSEVIHGNALEELPKFPDEYFHCVCTSPPYWGLRSYGDEAVMIFDGAEGCEHRFEGDIIHEHREQPVHGKTRTTDRFYGDESRRFDGNHQKHRSEQFCQLCGAWRGQFGLEPDPQMYVDHLLQFMRQVWRVLRDDGVFFLNIGDSYAGSGVHASYHANPGLSQAGKRGGAIATPVTDGLKPKDLVMIPFRVALAAQADGWWVHSVIPWYKPNPMPESVRKRPTTGHEYILLLSKSGKAQYWTHERKRGSRTKPKADYVWKHKNMDCVVDYPPVSKRILKKFWSRSNLWKGHDYFYDIDAVRKPQTDPFAKYPRKRPNPKYDEAGLGNRSGDTRMLPGGRNRRTSDWFFEGMVAQFMENCKEEGLILADDGSPIAFVVSTQPYPKAHFATFPPKLVEPMVLLGAPPKVCAECGAPWERVVEKERNRPGQAKKMAELDYEGSPMYRGGHHNDGLPYEGIVQTLGWRPTCQHDATKTVPARVLDLFAGRGTVAEKCIELGRDYVMIEIMSKYLPMIEESVDKVQLALGI